MAIHGAMRLAFSLLLVLTALAGSMQASAADGAAEPFSDAGARWAGTTPSTSGLGLWAGIADPSGLAASDDADPDRTEVWIVSGQGATSSTTLERLTGVEVHVYPQLDMLAIHAPAAVAERLAAHGLDVHRNEVYDLHLDASVPYIQADKVKQQIGSARSGASVMVIDTGLDSNHPDFDDDNVAANVAAERSPNGLVAGTVSGVTVVDRSGHGTHVAGIVAGSGDGLGSRDPRNGQYQGAYSNGRLISFQAGTESEEPGEIGVDLQAALEAFDWALANQDRYQIRAITNSWGSPGDIAVDHPAAKATFKAYAAGMAVVFSAGNEGTEGTLNKHCLVPWVLCVAAGDLEGKRSSFSSMGHADPTAHGPYDHPDITAPGSRIRSTAPTTTGGGAGSGLLSDESEALYEDRSGTSMAAPHAAAVLGLLATANAELSPDQLMDIVVATATPMAEEVHRVGAGYLNAAKAYNLAVQTEGERRAFLSGEAVKYGGAATGDPDFAADPVSVGYDSESGGDLDATLITGPTPEPWLLSSWVPYVLLGAALLFVVAGVRFRPDPASRLETPAQEPAEGTSEG